MANIRHLSLHGFMKHRETDLQIPDTGVVLVTGPNGSCKTGLMVEAVAYAFFGKTLRGKQPWPGDRGSVSVVTDQVEVTCTKRGAASAKVEWAQLGGECVKYDTPTKARAALAPWVGSFDTWRRTSVFSGSDATHFSLATDAERKLLVERLLGLERFDEALKACRADAKTNSAALNSLLLRHSTASEKVRGLEARITDAEQVQQAAASALVPVEKVNAAAAAISAAKARQKALEAESAKEQRAVAEAEAAVRTAAKELAALNHDACPTCGADIAEDRKCALRSGVEAANAKAKTIRAEIEAAAKKRRVELAELEADAADHKKVLADAEAAKRSHAANAAAVMAHAAKLAGLRVELAEARTSLGGLDAKVEVLRAEATELELVEAVLGLRGVRAHLLGKALRALTGLANSRLSTLLPGASLLLAESGDKLVMEVFGMAHEEGYAGCSSGERRRLDMAVLFALADLEALSRGAKDGTLHLDEIDGGLDSEGIDAVADLIEELAKTRAVILITHNKDMVARLQPHAAMHVRVDDGAVSIG